MKFIGTVKYILCLFFFFTLQSVIAQKIYKTSYLKFSDQIVDSLSQADFARTIYYPENGNKLAKVVETFKNGKIKKEGYVDSEIPELLYYDGLVTFYYLNGNKNVEATFKYGSFNGPIKSFYYNGKINFEGNYYRKLGDLKLKLNKLYNIRGENTLDEKGTGYFESVENQRLNSKGNYKNGFKDGAWESVDLLTKEKFEEVYKNEEFFSGTAIDLNGNKRMYKELETYPYYEGNASAKNNSSGGQQVSIKTNDLDGFVIYSFDVDRFGYTKNFKLINSLSKYSDQKALEFIKKKKWHPASYRGTNYDTFGYQLIIEYHLD